MTRERFIELVTTEQEPLRRFLLALCGGDRMAAEDIAQDALIKAYLASSGFMEQYKFRTWLFKIAYRTFLDYRKRPNILTSLSTHPEALSYPDAANRPDEAFRYELLYRAISLLPEKERAATILYHLDGYTVIDIAQITNSNPVAVRQRLSRGLRRLKEILKP